MSKASSSWVYRVNFVGQLCKLRLKALFSAVGLAIEVNLPTKQKHITVSLFFPLDFYTVINYSLVARRGKNTLKSIPPTKTRFGVTVPNLGEPIRLFNLTGDTVLGHEGKDSVCI